MNTPQSFSVTLVITVVSAVSPEQDSFLSAEWFQEFPKVVTFLKHGSGRGWVGELTRR